MESVAKLSEMGTGSVVGGKALEGLLKFIEERRHSGREYEGGFEAFEREVNGASECPLELRAGIVEGLFTPLAARMGVWAMTPLTSLESENLFRELPG
jgi:hypothetical protein